MSTELTGVLAEHVAAAYDGEYDETNLPDPLILSNYFSIRDGKIISLVVLHNTPSPY